MPALFLFQVYLREASPEPARYSRLSTVRSDLLSIHRIRKQREHVAFQRSCTKSSQIPSPFTVCMHYQNSSCGVRNCPAEINMPKDASPHQGCLTSNAFRILPSLSLRLHKCLYVLATFTIHSLGKRRVMEGRGKIEREARKA